MSKQDIGKQCIFLANGLGLAVLSVMLGATWGLGILFFGLGYYVAFTEDRRRQELFSGWKAIEESSKYLSYELDKLEKQIHDNCIPKVIETKINE